MTTNFQIDHKIDEFGLAYLRLTLELNKHIDGYVDAYYGPPEIKAEVELSPARSVIDLRADLDRLRILVPGGHPARQTYLETVFRSMECSLKLIAGEPVDYHEEVSSLYDVPPTKVDESVFIAAHSELDGLFPGKAPLPARIEPWRSQFNIPTENLLSLLKIAREETRQRTLKLFKLADDESIDISLTSNQPWRAYNWYKGKAHSLIEFNTDILVSALDVADLFAHEAYPGHHTEHQHKEIEQYYGNGFAEFASQLLLTPAAVLSEGVATTAVEIIFPNHSHYAWTADVLLPAAKMPATSADFLERYGEAKQALRYVSGNAAILYHTGQNNEAQTIDYCITYALVSETRARQMYRFLASPLFRAYPFTYTAGYDLIAAVANKTANGDKLRIFTRLLHEELLPSQLAQIATSQ